MAELKFSDLVEPVAVDQKTALRITVLGGGSFGTAMANLAVRNGCDTMIWIRDAAAAEEINQTHINKRYLPDYPLEPALRAVADLSAVDWSRPGDHCPGADAVRQTAGRRVDHDVFCLRFRQHRYGQWPVAGCGGAVAVH